MYITEVLHPANKKGNMVMFDAAKAKERGNNGT